jgi:predicted anti-sigma-YlaC factor YlaD
MSCTYSHLDGVYVLGALAPAERQQFEAHLSECSACAGSVRELAGLPGLLGRVDLATVQEPVPDPPVPATLLPALVREVRSSQRRRLLVTAGLAAAAAVVVTAGTVATLGTDPASPRPVTAPSAAAGAGTAQDMVPVGYGRMAADLALVSVPWGTRLDLSCSYASGASGELLSAATYSLVVHTRDGGVEQVATWRALPGRTMKLNAATAADRSEITSVEVRTADGQPVLELTT